MSSTASPATAPAAATHRMPFGRWFAEIGWRHVVGLLAVAFAVFPILFVLSASVNPSGSLSATGLIPTDGVTFEHYAAMLSGERANFLRWYLNTIIVCGVVAVVQVFLSLLAVPIVVILTMGGWDAVVEGIRAADAAGGGVNHFSMFENATLIGVLSSLAWGLGYFGQPHIIVRFMALRTPHDAAVARRVGIGWMALSVFGAVMVALVGIAYFQANPGTTLEDPETVFLVLASIMFHPFVAGLVLAAVLAAIMSTLSSQLIVCSSALVEDLYMLRGRTGSPTFTLWLGRIGVLVVALVAGLLALNPDSSVLELVSFAWAGFGAAFGPVILLALYWPRFTSWGAMAAMVTGAAVAWVWSEASAETWEWFGLYELLPGFVAAFVVGVVVSLVTQRSRRVQRRIDAEFTGAIDIVAGREPHPDVAPAAMTRDAAGGSTAAAADPRAQA